MKDLAGEAQGDTSATMRDGLAAATAAESGRPDARFRRFAAAIVVLALLLRLFYVFDAKVAQPIAGDVNQYVLYAWNLVHDGTFSSSLPNRGAIVPDSYRGPGYPVLLAASMQASGGGELALRDAGHGRLQLVAVQPAWITGVYLVQCLLGALTVLLAMAIARFWMTTGPALCVGALTALWPHLISFSGVMLSETLFGFLLMLAVWLLLQTQRGDKAWIAACAGAAFAMAYLVNPVVALFPVFAGCVLLLRRRPRLAAALLVVYLIAPVGWSIRNASLAHANGSYERAAQNFVQGSWPDYLAAYNARHASPIANAIVNSESDEERAFVANSREGLGLMAARMHQAPGDYLAWYLARKPFLLWDWSIRVGWGDVYFLATPVSPFTRVPALGTMKAAFAAGNPVFFALALVATLACAWRFLWRPGKNGFAEGIVACLLLYLTLVHTVLQAEPRYSVPYRPEELLMSVTAATWLIARVAARFRRNRSENAAGAGTPG
ncbi:MAG TPA: hypothetical protein VGH80_09040 [Xanthomonadaceae bacterium]|jgi:hypothetical protein